MNTSVRHRIENHAAEACIERYRGAFFCEKEAPLLAMREVSCVFLLGGAKARCLQLPDRSMRGMSVHFGQQIRESKMIPENEVWKQNTILSRRQPFVPYVPIAPENPTISQVI
jgi:hypothetical protein